MESRLSRRDRRAFAVGAVIGAPALLWRLLIAPALPDLAAIAESYERERALLQQELAVVASMPTERRNAEVLVEQLAPIVSEALGPGSSLDADLRTLASGSSVAVDSIIRADSIPARVDLVARVVRLRLYARSDLEGLLTLLSDLQFGDRLYLVEELELEAVEVPSGRPEHLRISALLLTFDGADPSQEGQDL